MSNNVFGTAAHVIYDKTRGYGFASQGSILFGCTRSANGGISTTALYGITNFATNGAWVDAADYNKVWQTDFGHMKANLFAGTAPANLALHTGTVPTTLQGSSYGYNGEMNDVMFSRSQGYIQTSTNWSGLMYEATYNTVPIYGGMSGGPLLDSSSRVVGINSNIGNGKSRFVKMRAAVVNSFK